MKRIAYLCCLAMTSLTMTAQIDTGDLRNWTVVLDENFEGSGRDWNAHYYEIWQDSVGYDPIWKCLYDFWPSGVTLDTNRHQISQRRQCLFNNGTSLNDNMMRIVAAFGSDDPINCGAYEIPAGLDGNGHHFHCDTTHHSLYYYSGNIETVDQFRYGYFEIRCKTPVHDGAFPAFWLFGTGRRYEEIDVYEYSRRWVGYPINNDSARYFNTGMMYGKDEQGNRIPHALKIVHIGRDRLDLGHWHTFGLEWLPDRLLWYFDGAVVNEYYDRDSIPSGLMAVKANYSIDRFALENHINHLPPAWRDTDTMVIDYIKVYQLNADCEEDCLITRATQLDSIRSMKRTITFCSTDSTLVVPSSTVQTIRAEEITLNGMLEIASGAQLAFVTSLCPCSGSKEEKEGGKPRQTNKANRKNR